MSIAIPKPLLLLPLILVIMVSGCTLPWGNGDVTGESNVLVIESLTAIPSTIKTEQKTSIVAVITNNGEESIPQSGPKNGGTITAEIYDYCPGLFVPADIKCGSGGTPISDGNAASAAAGRRTGPDGRRIMLQGTNTPVTKCQLGAMTINEKRQVEWEFRQSPEQQVETSCDMKMLLKYPYTTTGLTPIHLIEQDEKIKQIAEGTYQAKESDITKGEGPVKVWFEVVSPQPVSVERGQPGELTIALHIENTGQGSLVNNQVKITGITLAKTDANGGDNIVITTAECEDIKNYQDKQFSLVQDNYLKVCSANISPAITDFPKESTVHATVTIEYEYEVTKSVKVTVEPMETH